MKKKAKLSSGFHAALRFLVMVLATGLAGVPVEGQDCPPTNQPVSLSPWIDYTVITHDCEASSAWINALWVENGETVWVGTKQGLARYDGYEWHHFSRADGLAGDDVRALRGDESGGLWIGTTNGLSHFSGSDWQTFTTDDGLIDDWVYALAQDNKQGLWVGTKLGVTYFDGREFDYPLRELDSRPLKTVKALISTETGEEYLGASVFTDDSMIQYIIHVSRQGLVARYPFQPTRSGEQLQAIADASDGQIWVGTDHGLYRLHDSEFEQVVSAESVGWESDLAVLSLIADQKGGAWLGTQRGLLHFDGQRVDLRPATFDSKQAFKSVKALQRTKDGTLWVGTQGIISRWNPELWRSFPAGGEDIWALTGNGNKVWVTSEDGLAEWNGTEWKVLSPSGVYGLWHDGTALWFASEGLNRLIGDIATAVQSDALKGLWIRVIRGDATGNIWIGTDHGLFRFRDGEEPERFGEEHGLTSEFICALLPDVETIWVGTDNGLVFREGSKWEHVTWEGGPVANTVCALAAGRDGSRWAGTDTGLRRLPPNSEASDPQAWLSYTGEHSLVSSGVNAIWTDANGQLWVGTNIGLNGLDDNGTWDTQDDDVWVSLTESNGLPSNRVTALWRDTQNALWVGTDAGVVRHIPHAQKPKLKRVAIGGEEIWRDGNSLNATLDWTNTKGSLDFAGANLAGGPLVFRYRLSQAQRRPNSQDESGWYSSQMAPIADVDTGNRYELIVKALDSDLTASEPVGVRFAVGDVPLWKRLWFRLLIGVVIIGLLLLIVLWEPLRRLQRNYKYSRPSYREVWDMDFSFKDVAQPSFWVETRKTYSRDLRLVAEGKLNHLFRPSTGPRRESVDLPYEQQTLRNIWRSVTDNPDQVPKADLARLATALFPEKMAKELEELMRKPKYRVRLRLNFDQAETLAALPWEAAQPADLEALGLNPRTAVSRFLPRERKAGTSITRLEPMERDRKLRILLLIACPIFPPRLGQRIAGLVQLDAETQQERFRKAVDGRRASIRQLDAGSDLQVNLTRELTAKLGKKTNGNRTKNDESRPINLGPPDVVHFIGHAGPHPRRTGDTTVILYGESHGQFFPLTGADLARRIRESQEYGDGDGPRLLVLHACRSGSVEAKDSQQGKQRKISVGGMLVGLVPSLVKNTAIMAVIGMQNPVAIESVDVFAGAFYGHVLQTQPLDYAATMARLALKDRKFDWTAPVLYMQMSDGMIYRP
jgi:ligand-binding sensor domain-containing protein